MGILTVNFHSLMQIILLTKLSTFYPVRPLQCPHCKPAINIGLMLDCIKNPVGLPPSSSRTLLKGKCNRIWLWCDQLSKSCALHFGLGSSSTVVGYREVCIVDLAAREQTPCICHACWIN